MVLARIPTARQGSWRFSPIISPPRGSRLLTAEETRDYAYVGDVAHANVLALEGDPPSGAYNSGTAVETSVNELYELLHDLSGKDSPAKHGPAKPGEQLRSSVDPALASRGLDWTPEVDLTTGLKETLRFFGAL